MTVFSLQRPRGVAHIMRNQLLALLPGIALSVWLYGAALLLSLLLASATALATEAVMLRLRGAALRPALQDLSAPLAAWLLVLALPPGYPPALLVLAVVAAISVKQLYGGLGQSPWHTAMSGVVLLLWLAPLPAVITPWPLALAWLAGAGWLLWQRQLAWQAPLALLATILLPWLAGLSSTLPWLGGATVLVACFVAPDTASSPLAARGRLLFGAGIGLVAGLMRSTGLAGDGLAFAVLLMNLAVPLLDHYTRPPVFGRPV